MKEDEPDGFLLFMAAPSRSTGWKRGDASWKRAASSAVERMNALLSDMEINEPLDPASHPGETDTFIDPALIRRRRIAGN